jgi:alkylation response protein AidB-like acyl-CoA dehydrogenase
MTALDTATPGTDEATVLDLCRQLLEELPPQHTDPVTFLGRQFDLGLAWVHFPVGQGGLGLSPRLQRTINETLIPAGAPIAAYRNVIGHGMGAPTLVTHGTEKQKERYLRPLFTGEEVWCQLFSEPGAGSDVAGLATKAVRDGDEWVVNGQKVWTTLAHLAKWGMLVARTDPDQPKHKGMTYFVVDMEAPGVEVRPLFTGEEVWCQLFSEPGAGSDVAGLATRAVRDGEEWIVNGQDGWCQLFSEPGAGSDLAALQTRAERDGDEWVVTGQKVWTTMAAEADWGICLARTDPDAPKHEGITCFLMDMSTPGIDVRPLRELTGFALFNEVFLDDVVVPDDMVVGEVDDGWRCARTTLENERVSMAAGLSIGHGVEAVLELAEASGALEPIHGDDRVRNRLGQLVVTAQAIAVMGLRTTLRALGGDSGRGPGPEASVRKLLGVEHEQRVQEVGMSLLGPWAAVDQGDGARWFGGFLGNRALSIGGGTSEIQRNVIAGRLLGLPRDP